MESRVTSQNIHFTHLISSKLISSLLSADIIIQITILVKTFFLTKYQKIPPTLLDSMGTLWYNKHNTKDEKRDRFSVMCLLNRCEASRFAACTYGIMKTLNEHKPTAKCELSGSYTWLLSERKPPAATQRELRRHGTIFTSLCI